VEFDLTKPHKPLIGVAPRNPLYSPVEPGLSVGAAPKSCHSTWSLLLFLLALFTSYSAPFRPHCAAALHTRYWQQRPSVTKEKGQGVPCGDCCFLTQNRSALPFRISIAFLTYMPFAGRSQDPSDQALLGSTPIRESKATATRILSGPALCSRGWATA
jgi:hypothetical protein